MSKPRSKTRTKKLGGRRGQRLPVARQRGSVDQTPVVSFVSLGCAKNLVDSERMLGQIAESGAVISGDESVADTVVVNTCGFLAASRQEALDILRELAERKRQGRLQRIVVAGCLVQRDAEKLLEDVPEIDALVGVNHRDDVPNAVWGDRRGSAGTRERATVSRERNLFLGDYQPQPWSDQGRLRLTPRHYAYVRLSEGCNQKCTFCTIPSIRGPLHCKTPAQLVAECRELILDGARELILIGQDTTSYGADLGHEGGLAGLLRELDQACDGARWLRLMYAYPSVFTDAMIGALADCQRVAKYVDLPLQHINDRILRAMARRVTRAQTEELLEKLRRRIPGVAIRTTFIVGFPGETEAEFEELLTFVRGFGFDAVGTFPYSWEPDTPAGRMKEQLDDAIKQERHGRLMLAQQELAWAAVRRRIGQAMEVVVDGPDSRGRTVGRHAGQAPDVDGVCILPDGAVEPGTAVPARCVAADGYDLIVEPHSRPLPLAK